MKTWSQGVKYNLTYLSVCGEGGDENIYLYILQGCYLIWLVL